MLIIIVGFSLLTMKINIGWFIYCHVEYLSDHQLFFFVVVDMSRQTSTFLDEKPLLMLVLISEKVNKINQNSEFSISPTSSLKFC